MFVLVLLFLLNARADFVAQIDTKGVLDKLAKEGMCHDSASARICRQLHWIPTKDEGVINHAGAAYVFIKRSSFESQYPGSNWKEKVPEDMAYKYYSFLLVARSSFVAALNSSNLPIVYIFFLEGEGDQYKPKSIFLAASQDLMTFAINHEESIQKDMGKAITEWIPPDDYEKTFQFKLIE